MGMEQPPTVNQTYIVASNPAVLAHLMRENEGRSMNPSAYITPASVFNTLAVDFDGDKAGEDASLTNVDVSLKTNQIPASELYKLKPHAAETSEAEEKIGQLMKSPSALERMTAALTASTEGQVLPVVDGENYMTTSQEQRRSVTPEPIYKSNVGRAEEQKPITQFQQAFQQFQNATNTSAPLVTYSSITSIYSKKPPTAEGVTAPAPLNPSLDKSKSLERNVTFQVSKMNSWDRNQSLSKPTRSHSLTRQLSAGQEAVYSIANRSASLERSGLPPQGFVASRASSIEMSKQGSLERNPNGGAANVAMQQAAPAAVPGGVYDMKMRGYRGGVGGGSLERNANATNTNPQTIIGPSGGVMGVVNRGGSLERNSGYSYNYYKSQLKQPDTEPFQEEIYDFGGANVKSCASIALKKSMAKGMMPPEFGYAHPMPPPPYSPSPQQPSSLPYQGMNQGTGGGGYGMRSAQPPPPPTRQWPPPPQQSAGGPIRPGGVAGHIAQAQQCMSIQGAPLSIAQQPPPPINSQFMAGQQCPAGMFQEQVPQVIS